MLLYGVKGLSPHLELRGPCTVEMDPGPTMSQMSPRRSQGCPRPVPARPTIWDVLGQAWDFEWDCACPSLTVGWDATRDAKWDATWDAAWDAT